MGETDRVLANAKLTLSLRVTGVRDDGYHLLDAEMVSIDLADELVFDESGDGLVVHGPVVTEVDAAATARFQRATTLSRAAGSGRPG